ncbi:MAG: hypothetical protein ACPG7F_00340 [Aggregatilineales bacterium]
MTSNNFDFDDVREALRDTLGDAIRRPKLAKLGNPLKFASGVNDPIRAIIPDDTGQPGLVWVHFETENAEPSPPFLALNEGGKKLTDDQLVYRAPVYVKTDESGQEVIEGLAPREAAEYFYKVNIRPQRSVDISQFSYGLLRPTDSPGLKCLLDEAVYVYGATAYRIAPTLTPDYGALIPATAGKAVAVLTEIDPVTQTFTLTAGAEFDYDAEKDAPKHREAFASYPVTVNVERFLCGWVRLYNGQGAVIQRDIYQAQELISKASATQLGGSGAPVLWHGRPIFSNGRQVYTGITL